MDQGRLRAFEPTGEHGLYAQRDAIQIGHTNIGRDQINHYNLLPKPPVTALHQLDRDIADFTGRSEELADLNRIFARENGIGRTAPTIVFISGMPGVGKSALALHLAHTLKPSFPEAQLYVRLSGPGKKLDPSEVLDRFVRSLGIAAQDIPDDVEARIDLYRSRLEDKRALIVLDNALVMDQVLPLLPTSARCAVIITSRQQLRGIDGATFFRLKPLPDADAVQLLERLVGSDRIAKDHRAAEKIASLCGNLPLAIRISGASMAAPAREQLPLAELLAALSEADIRLDFLADEDRAVRASFELSYQSLPTDLANSFRLLGLLVVPDFGAEVAGALFNANETETQGLLSKLIDFSLLEPVSVGSPRYRFHDLIQLFASEVAKTIQPQSEALGALHRAHDWYIEVTNAANSFLRPENVALDSLADEADELQQLAEFARSDPAGFYASSVDSALNWFDVERASLLALTQQAFNEGSYEFVLALAGGLGAFFSRRFLWGDWERTAKSALEAAQQTNNRDAEASALNHLGTIYTHQRRFLEAIECHEKGLEILHELQLPPIREAYETLSLGNAYVGDGRLDEAEVQYRRSLSIAREQGYRSEEGSALTNLGYLYTDQGRYDEAESCFRKDVEICRELGDRHGEAITLLDLTKLYLMMEDFDEAAALAEQAFPLFQAAKDRDGEAMALMNQGEAFRSQHKLDEAVQRLEASLIIFREIGDRNGESMALTNVGNAFLQRELSGAAISSYEQSLMISQELGDYAGQCLAFLNCGTAYMQSERLSEAKDYYRKSLVCFREVKDRAGEGDSLMALGNLEAQEGRFQEAIDLYEQSAMILEEVGNRRGRAIVLNNIGTANARMQQLEIAEPYFYESVQIFHEVADRIAEAEGLETLGDLYAHITIDRPLEAMSLYKQSLTLCRETNQRHLEAEVLCKLAEVEALIGLDEGRNDFQSSLSIFQELGDRQGQATVLGKLGDVFFMDDEYAEAVGALNQYLALCRDLGDRYGEGRALNNLGAVNTALGDYNAAEAYILEALSIFEELRVDAVNDSRRALEHLRQKRGKQRGLFRRRRGG